MRTWRKCLSFGLLLALSFVVGASAQTNKTNTLTPIPIEDGGTGATTAAGARTNLGIGTGILLLDANNTPVAVTNTTTETSIYSFTVVGGALSTNDTLRLRVRATYLNNSGTGKVLTVRIQWGGVTVITGANDANYTSNANSRTFIMDVTISNKNATNSQFLSAAWIMSTAEVAGTTSEYVSGQASAELGQTTAAVDTTLNAVVGVTVQHSAANASLTFTKHAVEILK